MKMEDETERGERKEKLPYKTPCLGDGSELLSGGGPFNGVGVGVRGVEWWGTLQ